MRFMKKMAAGIAIIAATISVAPAAHAGVLPPESMIGHIGPFSGPQYCAEHQYYALKTGKYRLVQGCHFYGYRDNHHSGPGYYYGIIRK